MIRRAHATTVVSTSAPTADFRAGVQRRTVVAAGRTRSYMVVTTDTEPIPGAALVLVFHGVTQNAAAVRDASGRTFDALAAGGNVVVAYLDGYRNAWNDARKSNDFATRREGVDDVAFTEATIDALVADLHVDPKRVYKRINRKRPLMTIPDFATEAGALLSDLVRLRRTLHADPEVGLDLPRTQRKVLDALAGLPLEITTGVRTSSVVAVLRGALPGPVVLLRGDMDALPLEEATGLEYASTNGAMHACGHDLHTAGLVGAARLLSAHRDRLRGSVIFMFQPGEEGCGGAKIMIEEGVLDAAGERPVAAYAIHVAPGPHGLFATRSGAATAGSNHLHVTIAGRGGHGSQPHQTLDPVPVAAEIVLALQSFVTRRFDAFDPVVLSVTRLDTGDGAINIIPEQAHLSATVRTASAASLTTMQETLPRLVKGIAGAHGLEAAVEFTVMYPVTLNDAAETARTMTTLRETFGAQRVVTAATPTMGSEDFAYVLEEIPGTFLALLASPPDVDPRTAEFNHSPRVLLDDAVLGDQAAALASLAFSRTQGS